MGNWEHMMAYRGHDEYYDERDLDKAFEDGRKQGWREAMEEAKHSGYGERSNYSQREMSYGQREDYPMHGGYNQDGYGERRGVKGTGPYSRMR